MGVLGKLPSAGAAAAHAGHSSKEDAGMPSLRTARVRQIGATKDPW